MTTRRLTQEELDRINAPIEPDENGIITIGVPGGEFGCIKLDTKTNTMSFDERGKDLMEWGLNGGPHPAGHDTSALEAEIAIARGEAAGKTKPQPN
jgi:hypothetical protein